MVLSRLTELFQVLPALLFAMVLVTLFRRRWTVVVFAIGLRGLDRHCAAGAPNSRLRHMEYANAARAMGPATCG